MRKGMKMMKILLPVVEDLTSVVIGVLILKIGDFSMVVVIMMT
jgi:uncharacterized membrane protein